MCPSQELLVDQEPERPGCLQLCLTALDRACGHAGLASALTQCPLGPPRNCGPFSRSGEQLLPSRLPLLPLPEGADEAGSGPAEGGLGTLPLSPAGAALPPRGLLSSPLHWGEVCPVGKRPALLGAKLNST